MRERTNMRSRMTLGVLVGLCVAATSARAQTKGGVDAVAAPPNTNQIAPPTPAAAAAPPNTKQAAQPASTTATPAETSARAPASPVSTTVVPVSSSALTRFSAPNAATVASTDKVTLDQAIERALRRNPSAQVAALELDRAEALVREARSASLPSLTGNVTYTRLDNDRVFGTRVVAGQDQLNANLSLSVPIIAPGKWVQWTHARDDAKVTQLSGAETRRQLAISVARTFLTVVSQHRVVEVNERALVTAIEHDRYAAERLTGGVGRRIDAARASQQASTTAADVERQRLALARSMEALGILLGEDRPIDVAVDPVLDASPDKAAATRESEQRLDVQVARARRESAVRKFRDSWVDFLPSLVGQFQPFYQTPASLTMPTTGWQALLMLTVPLYDGGMRYGASDERRVLRDQAELQIAGLLRQARSEVRIAYEAQRSSEASLAAAQNAARLAHDAEQMATLAYQAGASTNLEVIDAERQARDADTNVAVAEDALRQARLDLLIASGRFPVRQ